MADSALSLTKTAMEGTVGRVLAAIDEDKKLKAVAQQDLRFIVGEFQMMRSFLEEANDKERTSKKVMKTWVRQLRELAFDVEDCVEFVIHLDTTSARVWWSWVWRVVPLPSRITPAWARDLDQAVAQLKQLKARVEEVSQRNSRYNLLGGDDSGSTTLPPVPPEQLDADAFPSMVNILRDLWKANAKQSSSFKCNLKYLVADGRSNELRVISVWRSAGVDLETAHILNAAYFDSEICEEFKARAWVKMMQPFNNQEFLKSLLNQLVTSLQLDTRRADLLRTNGDSVIQDELRQLLSKNKYLIILEDLSSRVEWDLIRLCLPDCHNGSRIVISTQQLGIALSCTGEPYRVLQLALHPDNDRYIYAFYKPSGIGIKELVEQLGQRRVISLWGDGGGDTSSLVRDVYQAVGETAELKGLKFERFNWVDVPTSPFSLEGFCRCLDDEEYENPESYFADFSEKLCESCHLIVIEGLQSTEDWDLIKNAGLVPEDTKSCIVIIANEEAVAKYCHDDSSRKMDDEEQEEANNAAIIGALFAQEEEYTWGQDDRFGSHCCSRRMKEALLQFDPLITSDQGNLLQDIILEYGGMSEYGVTALWGATGVGKSALLRFLYYCAMTYSVNTIEETNKLPKRELLLLDNPDFWDRFERFGWVDVPDEPFDLAEFSRRLLLDFNSYDLGEMEKTAIGLIQGQNPIQRCYEIVHSHKCLVVIDGLRSTRDWDSIKQAFWGHYYLDSCIFVITIEESVAKYCATKDDKNHDRTIPVGPLDDKSALEIFKKIVDKRKGWDYEYTTELKLKHANRIVPKCGGLPKILDAVAKSDHSFWANMNDDFVTKLKNGPQFDHLTGVLSWMDSYFVGSSDSVKPCVFYLSIFPTNYKIRKAHLLRRWIAEGYSRDSTTGSSPKENAERLFSELVQLGIIQKLPGMPLCQINGFFREYIISQPMEDNLVFALEGQRKPNTQRTVQHLSIMEDWEREKHVFESIDVSRQRSLTVYGKWEPFFISDKMKRIRVLDLEGTSGVEDCCLEHIFGILLSLKFICLKGCESITCLPKTLGGLRQLESLDVSGTSIVTLPRAIIKLQKIQYIRAGCNFLPDEDSDDAVGSQQPSGTTDKQVDGARQKKLVGCCWTSTKSSQDSDDAVGSQQPSGRTPTPEAEGSDGDVVATSSPLPLISQDNKQVDGRRQKKLVGCCWTSNKSSQDSDDAVGSQQPSGTATRPGPGGGETGQPLQAPQTKEPQASRIPGPALTATPEAGDSDGGHQGQHQHHKQQYHKIKKVGRRCTSRLSSRLSPLLPCSCFDDNNIINGGVEVPVGIEDMPALHTLGIVNINSARGKEFLAKLKGKTKLPQLLKLSVCGIKKENWKDLCDAVSAHHHLESLSVVLDEDFTEDIYFDNPPKALKSIKVYGHIHRLPACIKDDCLEANLKDFHIEEIISRQEGMEQLVQSLPPLPRTRNIQRLCVKRIRQRELEFKQVMNNDISRPLVLNIIDCSDIPFWAARRFISIVYTVKELIIHCAEASNFRISSNEESGLNNLLYIETVCLKGYNEKAGYVAHLKERVAAHPRKPVFKFEKLGCA